MFLKMEYGVYFFFASLMILSIPFVFFLIPETKSVPLELMDELFDTKPTWKANSIVMAKLFENEQDKTRGDSQSGGMSTEKGMNERSESV